VGKFKRYSLTSIGMISLVLGIVGIVLPLLPTTPFLLLSACCFSHSSEKFHSWLINHRWFGPYIENYRSGRGMTLRVKVTTIALLWLSIGSSVIFFVDFFWAKLVMITIACCVSCYLLTRPTLKASPAPVKTKLSI